MRVTELANVMDITADTVRYYTRIGLISPVKYSANGYKNYNKTMQQRLKFILSARQLDFSVEEIKGILSEADIGHTACPLVRQIIEKRLQETEKQFQAALLLREKLTAAINDWQCKPDLAPTGNMICHLIEGEQAQGENNE